MGSQSRHRAARIARLIRIDENRLNMLIGELGQLTSSEKETLEARDKVNKQVSAEVARISTAAPAVGEKPIGHALSSLIHAQDTFHHLQEQIQDIENKKKVLVEKVMAQRAKLKGWEILLSKSKRIANAEQVQEEDRSADDQHLQRKRLAPE